MLCRILLRFLHAGNSKDFAENPAKSFHSRTGQRAFAFCQITFCMTFGHVFLIVTQVFFPVFYVLPGK